MFSQASVIRFTGGVYPSMHWGTHTLGSIPACTGADPPGSISACTGADTPPGSIPACTGADPPPMATAADGTHPAGMHSCLNDTSDIC